MTTRKLLLVFLLLAFALPLGAVKKKATEPDGAIERNAGNWRTWAISSGKDYRVPPPPGTAATKAELKSLADLISRNDAQSSSRLNSGTPARRPIDGSI